MATPSTARGNVPRITKRFLAALGFAVMGAATDDQTTVPFLISGTGAPAMIAPQGSLYLRNNGNAATTLYVNTNGITAWSALTVVGGAVDIATGLALTFDTGDLVFTSDGTNVAVTGTGDLVFADGVSFSLGTGSDIVFTGDGTDVIITGAGDLILGDDVDFQLGTSKDFSMSYTSGGASVDLLGLDVVDGSSAAIQLDTGDSTSATGANTSGLITIESGASAANGNAGGATGAIRLRSGTSDATSAFTGGASGALALASGATDCNDAGGTGGASGAVSLSSGVAASTLGTSGNSGAVLIASGSSADGDSGNITIRPGDAASGTPGAILMEDSADNTKAITFDLIDLATGTEQQFNAINVPLRATGTIVTAAVATMNAAAIEVIAAPGAAYFITVDSCHWFLDFNSAAYNAAAAGDTLGLKYTNGAGAALVDVMAGDTIGAAAADYHGMVRPVAEVIPVVNAAIVAHIDAGEWGAGDSPLKYDITYRIQLFAL